MKLYKGECEEILKQLPDQSIDAVITDPPYGKLAFNEWDKIIDYDVVCKELKRICKPKAAVILFSDYKEMFSLHKKMTDNKLKYRYFFTWIKPNLTSNSMQSNIMPLINTEYILVFTLKNASPNYYVDGDAYETKKKFVKAVDYKKSVDAKMLIEFDMREMIKLLKEGKCNNDCTFISSKIFKTTGSGFAKIAMKNVLNSIDDFILHDDYIERKLVSHKNVSRLQLFYDGEKDRGRLHPTQKPIDLMKKLVSLYTKEGDTVLDFTMRKRIYWRSLQGVEQRLHRHRER